MRSNLAKGTFVLWLVAAVFTGCTLFDRPVQPPKGRTADQLYKEGSAQLEQRNYRAAIEAFYKLKYDYPSDVAAMLADLKIADAHYAAKEYPQAIESYSDFRKMHPASPYIPYVVYMLGLCHYQEILTVDRDQTNTEKALSEFQYLLTHFPNTPYAYDANEKAQDCMKRLSDHEVYVGNFYYRMKKYPAAIQRFEAAITKYPSVPLDEEVLFALAEAYRLTQQPDKNQRTLKALLQQYPKGKYAKKAQALIDETPSEPVPAAPPQPAASPPQTPPPQVPVGSGTGAVPPVPVTKAKEERTTEVTALRRADTDSPLAKEPVPEESGKANSPKPGPTAPEVQTSPTEKVDAPLERPSPRPTALNQEPGPVPTAAPDASPTEVRAGSHAVAEEKGIAASPPETPAHVHSASREEDKGERPGGSGEGTPSSATSPPSPPPGEGKPPSAKTIEERMGFGQLKGDKPINISADRMDAFQRENRVIFEGNVVVNQEETYIYAQRITADMASQETGGGIQKVVAVKNVRITQNDRVATCDRAEFDHISRTIELSGRPKIWQGKDWIDGERVLVNLDQDKMTVVGGEEKRVSAVLHPKTVKEAAEAPAEAKGSRPTLTASFAPTTEGTVEAKGKKRRVAEGAPITGPEEAKGAPSPASDRQEAPSSVTTPAHAEEEDAARIARAALAERPKSGPPAQAAETVRTARQASTSSATSNLLAPVKAFVEQWRKAWESKDLDAYMACYSPRFQSEKRDWKAWRSYKAGLNDKYRSIRVEVEKLEITPHEGGVKASFVQRYREDGYQDVGRKVLELVQEDGHWKIIRETWRTL